VRNIGLLKNRRVIEDIKAISKDKLEEFNSEIKHGARMKVE
jgi:hypothetical protein